MSDLTDAQLRKAVADAEAAEVARDRAKREEREASSPAAARLRAAESRQKVAAARRDALAAQVERATSWVPDLSGVTGSTTTLSGDAPLMGALLRARALELAARDLAATVKRLAGSHPVLVTTQPDLATAVATRDRVEAALAALEAQAEIVLARTRPGSGNGPVNGLEGGLLVGAAIAGQVLPALLSAFSTTTTVRSTESVSDAGAVAVQVCAALAAQEVTVVLDGTHAPSDVYTSRLRTLTERVAQAQVEDTDAAAVQALDGLQEDLEAAVTVLTTPGSGGRAPIDVAGLYTYVGRDEPGAPSVLLLSSASVSVSEVLKDRRAKADVLDAVATAAVPWLLLDGTTLAPRGGGHAPGLKSIRQVVGDRLPTSIPDDLR